MGPDSYVSAMNQWNTIDAQLDSYEGPFYGEVSEDDWMQPARSFGECSYKIGEEISVFAVNSKSAFQFYFRLRSFELIGEDGSSVYEFSFLDGSILNVAELNRVLSDFIQQCDPDDSWNKPKVSDIVSFSGKQEGQFFGIFGNEALSSGIISVSKIDDSAGANIKVNFQQVVLNRDDNPSLTLNGMVEGIDRRSDEKPSGADYFPFGTLERRTLPYILSQAREGYNLTDFQTSLREYVSLLEEIDLRLAVADACNAFP